MGGIDAGDVDGDGIPEFIFSSNFNVGVYKYNSFNGWYRAWHLDSLEGTVIPYMVDANGDGTEEVVIATSHIPNYTRIYKLMPTYLNQNEQTGHERLEISPNPTNGNITIQYESPNKYPAIINIYDIMGRILYTHEVGPSRDTIVWNLKCKDGKEVSSGLYFIELKSHLIRKAVKVTILK